MALVLNGVDWNVVCYGVLTLDRDTSTATINAQEKY